MAALGKFLVLVSESGLGAEVCGGGRCLRSVWLELVAYCSLLKA